MSKKINLKASLDLEFTFDTNGYEDLDNTICSIAIDEFKKKISKDIESGEIDKNKFNYKIVGTDDGNSVLVTLPFKVKPGERNVNGILYEEESYIAALKEYQRELGRNTSTKFLIDRDYETLKENKNSKSYYVPFDKAIGLLEWINFDDYTAEIRIFNDTIYGLDNIDKYCIGCLIVVDSEPVNGKFIVECIKGFTLIPKEDIPNGSNNSSH